MKHALARPAFPPRSLFYLRFSHCSDRSPVILQLRSRILLILVIDRRQTPAAFEVRRASWRQGGRRPL